MSAWSMSLPRSAHSRRFVRDKAVAALVGRVEEAHPGSIASLGKGRAWGNRGVAGSGAPHDARTRGHLEAARSLGVMTTARAASSLAKHLAEVGDASLPCTSSPTSSNSTMRYRCSS